MSYNIEAVNNLEVKELLTAINEGKAVGVPKEIKLIADTLSIGGGTLNDIKVLSAWVKKNVKKKPEPELEEKTPEENNPEENNPGSEPEINNPGSEPENNGIA